MLQRGVMCSKMCNSPKCVDSIGVQLHEMGGRSMYVISIYAYIPSVYFFTVFLYIRQLQAPKYQVCLRRYRTVELVETMLVVLIIFYEIPNYLPKEYTNIGVVTHNF